jgi:chromosome segregation ATPase
MSKKRTRKEIDMELDDVVKTLKSDMIKALDIKEESKKLEEKVRKLKDKEIHLNEVVSQLKSTRDKLFQELDKGKVREKNLESKIGDLADDKAALESDKLTLREEIKNLKKEKEQMQLSLEKTNNMLVELKAHIAEFDEEIRE